jgi:hypothetical protein
MPVELVKKNALQAIERGSKLTKTQEWQDFIKVLDGKTKLPKDSAIRMTLSAETVKNLNTKGKPADKAMKDAITSFRQKITNTFKQFRVRVAGNEIAILNRDE